MVYLTCEKEVNILELPNCPKCASEYTYEDRELFICSMCAHEWKKPAEAEKEFKVFDANGVELSDGDTIIVIKTLKVKGSKDIKQGTKVKNIKLVNLEHNIDCRIDGHGKMSLKSEFVKKLK